MKRPLALVGTLAVTVGVLAGTMIAPAVGASSHREAPSISKDPSADNTDVYAFVTPGKTDTVTMVANYIPDEEPSGGPNFYEWDPSVLYEIHIHNGNGTNDEITYQFRFKTKVVNPDTFLYNTGPISFQNGAYANWNRPQTYTVTRVDEDGDAQVLQSNALVPPVNIGPRSTPFYDDLAKAAITNLPNGGKVFANPPASTQQIMHPALYKSSHLPGKVELPSIETKLGKQWKKLDDNLMGEFGWLEVFKQFLGEERAKPLAAAWEGDRYQLFENQQSKRLLLICRLHLADEEQAARFFGQYSELLEKKHGTRLNLFRRPNFFSFDTPDGGVFLRCSGTECLVLEGGDRALFVDLNKQIGLGVLPEPDQKSSAAPTKTVKNSTDALATAVAH